MNRIINPIILIVGLFVLVACSPQPEAPTPTPTASTPAITLTISGSGSVTPILSAIANEFEAANSGYVLEVLPGSDTGGGVVGTVDGTLDVAAMSRPARDSETDQGIVYVPFGNSVTAIMSHVDVGVTELTSEQLTAIFTGTITNWSEVGGDDLEIIVYVRDAEEGNTVDIREAFIGDDEFVESAQVMPSQTDMQNVLTNVEGSIGYGTWATTIANGANVVSLTIDGIGVDNSPESMVTVMGIGYLSDRVDDVQPLVDWLLSEAGQTVLASIDIVPVTSE